MHAVKEYEETSSELGYFDCMRFAKPNSISAVEHCGEKEIYTEMILKGQQILFHVDCRATVNVLSAKYARNEEN